MFHFRIIACDDGTDIIDTTLKTPYESLTPSEMVEYTEMDKQIAYMERMKERERRKAGRGRNLLYKAVCMLGLVPAEGGI